MSAAASGTPSGLSEVEHKAQLRRAVIASTVGTTIEWYDFLLYGTVTALVFGKLFFPKSNPIVGVLEAFSVFFIGFVGRPIGAFIFGHWGDRIGRKATLIVTLLVTGIATVAVGCVPGYDSIGIWGAILLTVIRLIQGIGVGGEWGGSVLLAMEWARTNKNRGFLSAWPQFGAPCGLFLANCAVLFFSWYSGDQFLTWGWRIPFFLSAIMVGVGLWIRLGIMETPVFQKILDEERTERVPVLEVLKRQPKQIILTALLRLPEQAPGYIVGAWIFTYATGVLGYSRDFVLLGRHQPDGARFHLGRIRRILLRLRRPKEHVHNRRGVHGRFRLRLHCHAEQRRAVDRVRRDRRLAVAGDDPVRAGGRVDRGELHPATTLQRHLDRLPACLGHRGRAFAVHFDLAVMRPTARLGPSRSISWHVRSSASSRRRC